MSLSVNGFCRFDEFELDRARRVLLCAGQPITLAPKTYEVLSYLAANAGRVVTKDELLQAVWPGSFVEENNLVQHISLLRKALQGHADYVATIPGTGYQFTAPVQSVLPGGRPHDGDVIVQTVRERTQVVVEESSTITDETLTQARPGSHWARRIQLWMGVAAALALAAAGTWIYFRIRPSPPPRFYKLTVAEITNGTGDPDFDHILKQALEIDLEQSPSVDVMSGREAVATLKLMGLKPDAVMTPEVGREVCQRANRQVLLTGSIVNSGSGYLVTLNASDCTSGNKLTSARFEAQNKAGVLAALDRAAERIRKGMGESAASRENFNTPLMQATTASLEALRAYSLGARMEAQNKPVADSLPYYERAVDLDPRLRLGLCSGRHRLLQHAGVQPCLEVLSEGLRVERPGQRQGKTHLTGALL